MQGIFKLTSFLHIHECLVKVSSSISFLTIVSDNFEDWHIFLKIWWILDSPSHWHCDSNAFRPVKKF